MASYSLVRNDIKLVRLPCGEKRGIEMFDYLNWGKHTYTLAATGIKFKGGIYSSRQSAEHDMYNYINKHGYIIKEVYDDKHYKTYCCNNGIKFYINRM